MPRHITDCDEGEGANGKRVSREEPPQLTRLVVDVKRAFDDVLRADAEGNTGLNGKLRGTDDGGKEDLAGERLGTFYFGIIVTVLTVFARGLRLAGYCCEGCSENISTVK